MDPVPLPLLRIDQLARRLTVSVSTIRRRVDDGSLRRGVYRLPGKGRVLRFDLLEVLEEWRERGERTGRL